MLDIIAPDQCPSCSYSLESINSVLYCRNTLCSAQSTKKIEHFAKTLKIKGLGPATVKKLGITEIHELYYLEEDMIAELLGSERLAEKLFAELLNSHYEVKSTVTKDVTILVNESGIESAKVKKARESGVTIITNLSHFIGE